MEKYTLMREFADSWFLLVMFAFFIGVVVWVFRPGSARQQEDAAEIPFRHENKPACDDTRAVSAKNPKEARQ